MYAMPVTRQLDSKSSGLFPRSAFVNNVVDNGRGPFDGEIVRTKSVFSLIIARLLPHNAAFPPLKKRLAGILAWALPAQRSPCMERVTFARAVAAEHARTLMASGKTATYEPLACRGMPPHPRILANKIAMN